MLLFVLFVILDVLNNPATLPKMRRYFFLNIALLIVAMLFKILHWKGAGTLILVSLCLTPVLYFIQLFIRRNKPVEEIAKAFFITVFAAYSLFAVLHWPYAFYLMLLTIACFLIYFLITATKFFKNKKHRI